uniref:Serpentine receptor class gamma n=1 Tax=Strongyloides venezuelensis TaxID=75913 RepID=A0A0K0FFB2_STRVS
MNFQYVIFYINLLYGIPSFILLIIIEIILLIPSNKKIFYSSFFKIIFFNGVFDILAFVTFTIHHRLPSYGMLVEFYNYLFINEVDVRSIEFLRSVSTIGQLVGMFFLCFNRFTSVYFHVRYDNMWKYLLPVYYVTVTILPVLMTFPLLLDMMIYKPFDRSNINLGFKGKWMTFNAMWYNSYVVTSILNIFFLTLCVIINFSTLFCLIRYKRSAKSKVQDVRPNHEMNYSMEKKFFLLAVVCFIGQLIFALSGLVVDKFSQNKEYRKLYVMSLLFPIIADLTMFPNIWLLVLISSNLRNSIKRLFYIKNMEPLSILKNFHTTRRTREK